MAAVTPRGERLSSRLVVQPNLSSEKGHRYMARWCRVWFRVLLPAVVVITGLAMGTWTTPLVAGQIVATPTLALTVMLPIATATAATVLVTPTATASVETGQSGALAQMVTASPGRAVATGTATFAIVLRATAEPTVSPTAVVTRAPVPLHTPTVPATVSVTPPSVPIATVQVRGSLGSLPYSVRVPTEPFPFASITAGGDHTCGFTANGTAYCWGANDQGQLGDGTTDTRVAPSAVTGGLSFSSLTAGGLHTCGLTVNGMAYCWGANDQGQLGDGTSGTQAERNLANRTAPVRVTGALTFSSLVAGSYHTCGLTASGTAYCWGHNDEGQLGDGFPGTNRLSPVAVLGGRSFTGLALGAYHTCGLTGSGTAYCWGSNWSGGIGDGTSGYDEWDYAPQRNLPVAVRGGVSFSSLTAGSGHTCGLTGGGEAYCWGWNYYGQLGDGTGIHEWNDHATDRPLPAAVTGGRLFTKLSARSDQTCAVTSVGDAYCWGAGSNRQFVQDHGGLGPNDSASPVAVGGGLAFASVATGDRHTCALTVAGMAHCWGVNQDHQLGDGNDDPYRNLWSSATPVAVAGGTIGFSTTTVTDAYSVPAHTCGLTSAGIAYCWGANASGQLGDGTTTARMWAVAVVGGLTFRTVVAGSAHTCGLTFARGSAYCWGANTSGQIGDGTTTARTWPVAVTGDLTFRALDTGSAHSCGLTFASGSAYCWGANTFGQIGDGTTTDRHAPVAVSTTMTFTDLTASGTGTTARSGGLGLFGWGTAASPASSEPKPLPEPPPNCFCFTGQPPGHISSPIPFTSPSLRPPIHSVRTANVRDTSLTVSWTTDIATTGSVAWRPVGGATSSVVTSTASSTVHFVNVTNLIPSTRYLFNVLSGGSIETNGGAHFTVTTGPVTNLATPDQVFGKVVRGDGTTPTSVIIHLTASGATGTGAPLAYEITAAASGTWILNVGDLRTADATAPYVYTDATVLTVQADGGVDGVATGTTTIADARLGRLSLTLNDQMPTLLNAGWNLFALRVSPATTLSASMICTMLNDTVPGSGYEIDRWQNSGWEGHRCGLAPNDFAIGAGRGYFIRVSKPVTLTIAGTRIVAPPTIALGTGWNLVGVGALSGGWTVAPASCSDIDASGGDSATVELDRWEAGAWEGHRCGLPVNAFPLQAGRGYFVRLTRPAIWAPAGGAP